MSELVTSLCKCDSERRHFPSCEPCFRSESGSCFASIAIVVETQAAMTHAFAGNSAKEVSEEQMPRSIPTDQNYCFHTPPVARLLRTLPRHGLECVFGRYLFWDTKVNINRDKKSVTARKWEVNITFTPLPYADPFRVMRHTRNDQSQLKKLLVK